MTVNEPLKLRISAVGDISLGDHPVCVGHGMRSALGKYGNDLFKHAAPVFKNADVAIANLETVTSNSGYKKYWLPSYEMRGDPDHLRFLKESGVDIVGVANNHAMQHGEAAFLDMVKQVEAAKLSIIGLDSETKTTNHHTIKHDSGEKSFIFAVSLRPEEWFDGPVPYSYRPNFQELLVEIENLKSQCDGFLVCSIHWGLEFLDIPGPEQRECGRALIDAGVDLVLGHHPHVLQPVETYRGGLIFYSLGNFAFDLWGNATKYTGIATIYLSKAAAPEYSFFPMFIGEDLIVRPADGVEAKTIENLISPKRVSETEGAIATEDEYRSVYRAERLKFRYSSYRYFLKNCYRYPFLFFLQSLGRTALRRLTGT